MATRFHTEVSVAPGLVSLAKDETQHLLVSRVKVGSQVVLFTGDGFDYPALVLDISRHGCTLQVQQPIASQLELPSRLIVCAPLPKGDREQFLVEKLTELGVSRFVPLRTERSVIHPEPKRLERLRRHVIEASKQCGRSCLMEIGDLLSLEGLIESYPAGTHALWFGHVPDGNTAGWSLPNALEGEVPVAMVVGPEGGLDPTEVQALVKAGWRACGLGRRKLRVETAAMLLASQAVRLLENPA